MYIIYIYIHIVHMLQQSLPIPPTPHPGNMFSETNVLSGDSLGGILHVGTRRQVFCPGSDLPTQAEICHRYGPLWYRRAHNRGLPTNSQEGFWTVLRSDP